MTELSYNAMGFTAAMLANVSDCLTNVMSKKLMLQSYDVGTIQLYTSVIGAAIQTPLTFWSLMTVGSADLSMLSPHVCALLVFDGMIFYFQSIFAYCFMNLVHPLSHSVVSTMKRAVLILLSILHFGAHISPTHWAGISLLLLGVLGYNRVSYGIQDTHVSLRASSSAKAALKTEISIIV